MYQVRNRLIAKVLLWWLLTLLCSFLAGVIIFYLRFGQIGILDNLFENTTTYEEDVQLVEKAEAIVDTIDTFEAVSLNDKINLDYLLMLRQHEQVIIDYNDAHKSLEGIEKNTIISKGIMDEVLKDNPFELVVFRGVNDQRDFEVYLFNLSQLKSLYMFRYVVKNQFIIFAVVILANTIFALLVIRRTSKPIFTLHKALEAYKQDDFSYRLPQTEPKRVIDVMNKNINEMAEALEKNQQTRLDIEKHRLEFIAKISHDTKTPLASIRAHAEGFRDGLVDTESKRIRYADNILSKVHAIDYLINELSLYSNLSDGTDQYNFSTVELNEYLTDVLDELKYDYDKDQLIIEYVNHTSNSQVNIDPQKFYRIINNLVNNSVKYANREQVHLKVTLDEVKDKIRMTFKDNGIGVDMEDLNVLFTSFKRGEASRNPNQPGTGLGLAIVKTIVNKHRGEVSLLSEPNQYFEVVITLPRGEML